MNVITVYPIIKGAFKEELTYWSSHAFEVGKIIEVPLKGRKIPALVGEVTSASHAKSNIKQASFVTRKIEKTEEKDAVYRACIEACEKISKYYAVSFSSVLKACISDVALSHSASEKNDNTSKDSVKRLSSISSDVLVYQTNTEDRLGAYRSIVREEFARKKSVIIVAPTVLAAEELFNNMRKGIEDYAKIIHGSLTKKKQASIWKECLESDHPIIIVTTPYYASIPRKNVSTIILERESSRAYSSMRAPFIDYRKYVEEYAKALGARLIFGDTFLRIETLHRRDEGEINEFFPISYRVEKMAELLVVDMSPKKVVPENESTEKKSKQTAKKDKKEFKIFSEELESMIDYASKKSEKIFLFSARRGLSPQIVCGDCGKTVVCESCEAPVVLHQTKNGGDRFFLCHHCGRQRTALEGCKNCGSWKLTTLGIGIDTVVEELKKHFPKRQVFKIDRDTVTTDKQAKDVIDEFNKSKDGILLGTESALAFLPEVTYSAIVSLDSLFSIPDFRINERICHTLLRILEKTTGYVLLQTRNAENGLLKHMQSGTLSNFYREEIKLREMVNYPPFCIHIKITIEDTKSSVADKMKKLQDILEEWDPMIFPAFVPSQKGKSTLHMLLSLPTSDWPNNKLRGILAGLPKDYAVKINPESLL